MRLLLPLLLVLIQPAPAAPPPSAFADTLELIDELYLEPERVDEGRLLQASADRLSDAIHWLIVDGSGSQVTLSHGSGALIGSITVADLDTLPAALDGLEGLVLDSGYDPGDVDVRLELLKGLTDGLDRYSRILAADAKARFDVRLKGTQVGIGARLEWKGNDLVVTDITTGGPADVAGVRVGDVLERIDDRSVVTMPVSEATRRLRGRSGTQTVVSVRRGDAVREVALTREEVIVPNVDHRILDGSVGYVRIRNVSQKTVHNMVAALTELQADGALEHGLVLDLRGNTGGSMKESARTADLFLEDGLLLRTVGRDGGRVQNLQERMSANPGGEAVDLPVVVVVDERTASGSEILAGSLVGLGRAVLVGTRTYGKGSVQKLYPLAADTDLKLTVAQYLLADDFRIDHVGLVPDAVVGEVVFDGFGVRYHDFDEGRQRTTWDRIVPWVHREGADQDGFEDLPLEIARRTVIAQSEPTREAGLEALNGVVQALRVEEEGRLLAAMENLGVDWTAAPEEGSFLEADVEVSAVPWEGRHDVYRVQAKVQNRSDEPLNRVLVQLHCWSNDTWDDVVIPVGAVGAGSVATGEVAVAVEPGLDPREDLVEVRVRADGRAPANLGDTVLASQSAPTPDIRLAARLVDDGDGTSHAEVTIINEAHRPLYDVEVRFGWPGDLDVEIVDHAVRIPVVGARDRFRADLEMLPGENAPEVLPLKVRVEVAGFGVLARWPLELPTDGRSVTLSPPRISLSRDLQVAGEGPMDLPLIIQDDRAVDYVVVYHRGEKVAWSPGGKGKVRFSPRLDIAPGMNLVYVEAGDSSGIRSLQSLAIRGEQPVAADAGPEEEDAD